MRSGRLIDSTLITSAPRHPRAWLADGPAHHAVRSTTLIPWSGSAPAAPDSGGRRGSQSMAPSCSPGSGTGPKGRGTRPCRR